MDMTQHFPIYMDYGATTPCDQRVVDAMIPWLREHFGNPASRSHAWGWEAEEAVEKARAQVADRELVEHARLVGVLLGGAIVVEGALDLPLDELRAAYEGWMPAFMGEPA